MPKQRESRLSRQIMNALREEGIFCFKVHGSEHMMAGLPDIIACVDGYFVGLEVKHPETRDNLSERQKYIQKQIRTANGICETVTDKFEALGVVNHLRANQKRP